VSSEFHDPGRRVERPCDCRSDQPRMRRNTFRDIPACVKRTGHALMRPLAPNQYDATLFESSVVVPIPPPIAVRVTP